MNIVILIIASSNHDKYIEMQEIWRKYMNMYPNIKSYFIKNDPSIEEDVLLKEDTIYCRENETYMPGITNKTVLAIDYCLQHYQFDYIYRTNLSSVLHLQNLYDFCLNQRTFELGRASGAPDSNLTGNLVEESNGINHSLNYGGVIGNHEGLNYASGCGFLLSKEACLYLTTNAENLLKHQHIDDVCIGILLKPIFGIQPINRCDIYIEDRDNNEKYIVNKDLFHYRCKSDHDHWYTVYIMNKLYDMIYRV